jgi:hypothetical protein
MVQKTVDYIEKEAVTIETKIKEGESSTIDPSVKVPLKDAAQQQDRVNTLRLFSQNLSTWLIPEGREKLTAVETAAYHEANERRIKEKRAGGSFEVVGEPEWRSALASVTQAEYAIKNYFSKEGIHSDTILKILNYPKFKGEDRVESKGVEEFKNAMAALNEAYKPLEQFKNVDYNTYIQSGNAELIERHLAEFSRARERADKLRARLTNRIFVYEWKAKILKWGTRFWNCTGGLAYSGPAYVAKHILPGYKLVQYPFSVVTLGLAMAATLLYGYVVVKILSYVPWMKKIFAPVADLAENGFTGVFGGADPNANNYWGVPVEGAGKKEPLGIWGMAGLGVALAAVLSPRTVIPFVVKTISGLTRGIGGIVGGKPGRGRPAGVKKPGVGPGAPPNVQKAISAIRRGREEGNPFLVKKGVEALKKAKAMGLPVPKGIID